MTDARGRPGFTSLRELTARAIAEAGPAEGSLAEARLKAAATLELARALHHLRRTKSGRHVLSLPLLTTPTTKVKGNMQHTDTPSELIESSDGVSDDGALDQQIIGACRCDAVSGLGDIAIGSGLRQHLSIHDGVAGTRLEHLSVAGLSDIAIGGGIPSYLFTKKNLSNPQVRLRIGQAIRSMTPKMRRRVVGRLQQALRASRVMARVSGAVRNVYPSVSGYSGGYPTVAGWNGIMVSGRRSSCPYANVVGALTP